MTTSSSDARMKTDIQSLEGVLEKVLLLNGVSYVWKEDTEKRDIGFIAQEVEKLFPEVVFTNKVDGYMGINYSRFPAILAEAIKEQQKIIKSQQKDIQQLHAMVMQFCESGCGKTDAGTQEPTLLNSLNVFPNPANQKLNVSYAVITGKTVQIELLDMHGKILSGKKLNNLKGTELIDVSEFSSGNYLVTLLVDGVLITSQTVAISK